MAASNDSQGLKIAVAAFVSLSVILSVSCYFLYSNYSQTDALRIKADSAEKTAKAAQNALLTERDEMKKLVGARADDFDAAKTEIKNSQKAIDDKIAAIPKKVDEAIAKAQAAGATGPEIQEHRETVKRLITEYQGEVNKTYISSLSRMTDIYENLDLLFTDLAMHYAQAKRNLESTNSINKTATDALSKAVSDAKTDLDTEQKKHMELRADLNTKVDLLQTERDNLQTQLAAAQSTISDNTQKFEKKHKLDQEMIRELRDRLERGENVLDVPDGRVTFVDYTLNELHTNVTRSMGARPQMVLSIFDRHSPGIPTEKPKATIELIQVGDRYSVAKIIKTMVSTEPIRVGDIVHSAAWSPNEPTHFALIGKIDINRDGRDDREDLKRMIKAAGGVVDYDLPPPFAGKESGQLTARCAWYVVNDKPPLRDPHSKVENVLAPENVEFDKKMSEATKEARLNGVRPLPLSRFLSFLGYDFAAPVVGRTQAYDRGSMNTLLRARQGQEQPAVQPDAAKGDAAKGDAANAKEKDGSAGEMKDDEEKPAAKPKKDAKGKKDDDNPDEDK